MKLKTRPATLLSIALLTVMLAYTGCAGSSSSSPSPTDASSTSSAQPTLGDPTALATPWLSASNLQGISAELPFDDSAKQGQLPNGLTYYVQANAIPPGTAQLGLFVKAGSANERDDQRGYAHFLEHMLFAGTESYSQDQLADFLGTLGAEVGPDVSAYTSYDETGYLMGLAPFYLGSSKVKPALGVLREWASRASLEPAAVERVRDRIEAELRDHQEYGTTLVSQGYEQTMFDATPYDNRDPGGSLEAIRTTTAEGLREFYETWYQPQNMAVVAVGDFDAGEIETAIADQFSDLAEVADPPQSPAAPYRYQPSGNQLVSVQYSPQTTSSEAHLSLARPKSSAPSSAAAVLDELAAQAVLNLVSQRVTANIGNNSSNGANPIKSVSLTPGSPTTRIKFDTLTLRAEPNQLGAAIAGTIAELERLKRFGISLGELDQVKQQLQAKHDQTRADQLAPKHDGFVFSLASHFVYGTAHLSGADRHRIYSAVLAQLTPEQVQTWLTRQLEFAQPAVVLVGPEDDRDDLPTQAWITDKLTQAANLELEPRMPVPTATATTTAPTQAQLMERPEPSGITAERQLATGLTELTLANGARVIHYYSNLEPGRVSLAATSPGGEYQLSGNHQLGWSFPAAVLFESGIGNLSALFQSGIGELSAAEYESFKANHDYAVDPVIGKTRSGFTGVSATQDLEHALAHIHLTMTQPRIEQPGVAALVAEIAELLNYDSPAQQEAFNTLNRLHYGNDRRFSGSQPADITASLTVDNVRQLMRERFSNAAGFTFIFVGDVGLDTIKDLAQRYLGTLPATTEQAVIENPERLLPTGVQRATITVGPDDPGLVLLRFQTPTEYSTLLTHQTRVLHAIINTRITNLLSRELGADFEHLQFISNHYEPAETTDTQLFLNITPELATATAEQLVAELTSLGETLTSAEYETASSQLENQFKLDSNAALISALRQHAELPRLDLDELLNPEHFIDDLTYSSLKNLARRLLPAGHYIQVVVATPR